MTDGRYTSRNTTEKVNVAQVEEDTKNSVNAVRETIDVIDESIRTLPDSIEVLASRGDRDGIKKLLVLTGTANDDAERFKKELKGLEEKQDRVLQSRPSRPRHYADHYTRCFAVGGEAIELNQRVMNVSGGLVEQIAELLQPSSTEEASS
jgi:hypothetical protein